jgi:hypothetical protein
MKLIFKHIELCILFFCISITSFCQTSVKENDFLKTKKFTETYDLNKSDKASISNKFGNIKIITWKDNKIKVDVEIEVSAKTEARAIKVIDGINVKHNKSEGLVSFKTKIDETTNSYTSTKTNTTTTTKKVTTKNGETVDNVGEEENCNCNYSKNSQSMKINYTVYLPSITSLKLYNEFGNTVLQDYDGSLTIINEYGNLTAGKLTNENNEISVEYGNAEILSLMAPDFKIGYGNCDISNIVGNGTLNFDYCSDVSIGVNKETGDLKIGNDYSTMEINVNENANAAFTIKSSYGDVKSKNKALELKTEKDDDEGCCNFTKKHEGKIGNGKAKIKIDNEYGKVKFR